ncbi:hypothetical protein [Streptomyces sp. NPDC059176]|uniref:hypothetical protein n=1 Tax=unclassified Streptomyces TaxID=2593676 RepID=UPI0036C69AD4
MTVPEHHHEVSVQISGKPEDADAVFGALHTAYPCDRGVEEHPHEGGHGHPTIWIATYDVACRAPVGTVAATSLGGSVAAELSGSHHAVDELARALASGFAVEVELTASGDGEKQVRLRLDTAPALAA